MPTYLCHGFRWHRKSIQYYVVLQDVEDAAPGWIVAPHSAAAFLDSFYELFDFLPPCPPPPRNGSRLANGPRAASIDRFVDNDERKGRPLEERSSGSPVAPRQRSKSSNRLQKQDRRAATPPLPPLPRLPALPEPEKQASFNDWSVVKLLEEFDPTDESMASGPWAYVADYVVPIDMSISPIEEMMRYEERMKAAKVKAMSGASDETGRKTNTFGNKKAGWLEKLRDQLQRGEDIRWYVVICGDEERSFVEDENVDYKEDYDVRGRVRETPGNDGTQSEQGFTDDELEDDFEYRLPEFATYEVRPLEIQPLRLRSRQPQMTPQDIPSQMQSPTQEKPPAVPEKDYRTLLPPNPLQNLQEVGQRTVAADTNSRNQKSANGIRRLFAKKQIDSPI